MKLKRFNYKIINSTNDLAIKLIKYSKNKSGIIVAEKQKKGRGRYGKKWISYKGNLFVSIFFPINKVKLSLTELTTINCLLVKKVVSNFYKGKIFIKKPNDLLINKKKISGILQEILHYAGDKFVIVGIGINLIKSPKIASYPTTNLSDLTNLKISCNSVVFRLKKTYEKFIPILLRSNIKNTHKFK